MVPVLIFFGATASGKTSLASEIFSYKHSKDFSKEGGISALSACAEIISADSVQVYKHMHIGSASPSKEELEDLPHHLIAIKEPTLKSVSIFKSGQRKKGQMFFWKS